MVCCKRWLTAAAFVLIGLSWFRYGFWRTVILAALFGVGYVLSGDNFITRPIRAFCESLKNSAKVASEPPKDGEA